MMDVQGKLKSKKIDQMVSHELCANLIQTWFTIQVC